MSSYLSPSELGAANVPKDNPRFIREEIRKNSAGEVIEIRRYFLDDDGVTELYWQKEFFFGDPASAGTEDLTKRITIYPWVGPL